MSNKNEVLRLASSIAAEAIMLARSKFKYYRAAKPEILKKIEEKAGPFPNGYAYNVQLNLMSKEDSTFWRFAPIQGLKLIEELQEWIEVAGADFRAEADLVYRKLVWGEQALLGALTEEQLEEGARYVA